MSADPIIYCLEHLTDYRQFERLCSDVMNQSGYPEIEPLGGSNDRGRDALHVSRTEPNDITIFAYSVRSDWQKKLLSEDCKRIEEEKHALSKVVFVCTSNISSTQRDTVRQTVFEQFGWHLELFDIERLRVRLVGDLRHLVAQHSAIFCPPFFPVRGGLSIAESFDTLVIDHAPSDYAVATWLSRRLQLAGYRCWCYGTAPLAGENADESIRALLSTRAKRYLPIISNESLADIDFITRCGIAGASDGLSIPCIVESVDATRLPSSTRRVTPVSFLGGWKAALQSAINVLSSTGVEPAFSSEQGTAIALRSYVPEQVTKVQPEMVYANTFATTIPSALQVCNLSRELTADEIQELRKEWAFVVADAKTLLSFVDPPSSVPLVPSKRVAAYSWKHYSTKHNKVSVNVVKELTRRSLDVACRRAGLQWCDDRRKFYFAPDVKPQRFIPYVHVDGRKTRVAVAGQVTYGSGEFAKPFRYQLSPTFTVGQDESGDWWSTMHLYVRVTELDGQPFQGKAIIRRRKKVTKGWWNQEWFARIVAVIQAIENDENAISIGSGHQCVSICTQPLSWECPISIDYSVLDRLGDFNQELADLRYFENDEEGEVTVGVNESEIDE